MDKITVLKSRGVGYSMMIGDSVSTINPSQKTVEITDEEVYNKACEYAMAKYGALHQVSQRAELRNAYLEAYEYIKSRINK